MATDSRSSALPNRSCEDGSFEDPVVAELDAYREQYASQFGFDFERITADIQSRQQIPLPAQIEKALERLDSN